MKIIIFIVLIIITIFYGTNTQTITCDEIPSTEPSVCSRHGECTANDICNCTTTAYFGKWCHIWNCGNYTNLEDEVCNNKIGECKESEKCDCGSLYEGDNCETKSFLGILFDIVPLATGIIGSGIIGLGLIIAIVVVAVCVYLKKKDARNDLKQAMDDIDKLDE